MDNLHKILIGGKALKNLGSSRNTNDSDFLVNCTETKELFIFDKENNIDYINANGHKLFAEIYEVEKNNQIATPSSLLELKAFAFVQHCQNFNFQKADDCEFDIKFLVRKFNLTAPIKVKKYISISEYAEITKIINSVKK